MRLRENMATSTTVMSCILMLSRLMEVLVFFFGEQQVSIYTHTHTWDFKLCAAINVSMERCLCKPVHMSFHDVLKLSKNSSFLRSDDIQLLLSSHRFPV